MRAIAALWCRVRYGGHAWLRHVEHDPERLTLICRRCLCRSRGWILPLLPEVPHA
jgi:hypothetical protein